MSFTHKISRDVEGNAHIRREERAESSRRGFVREELNERAGSSRRLVDVSPSRLIDHHSGYALDLPYSGSTSHKHQDTHSMKRTYETQEATSAPACTNALASLVTWHGDTCQARHTTHYHHHYYHHEWLHRPIRCSHVGNPTICCCAINTPHDFSSHGGPPINCPVNISAPHLAPAKPTPVPTSQLKRFTKLQQAEKDLYPPEEALSLLGHSAEAAPLSVHAAEESLSLLGHAPEAVHAAEEAPALTVFKAGPPPPLKHCSRRLPPFPSSHASPYVLCQHCSRLLLLPPGTLLFPPPGTLLLQSFLFVKLKCGYCLNISKFSTRHLHRASSSSLAEGTCSPVPPPPPTQRPVALPSMPSCIASNGVMQEASTLNHNETEEPLNGIFELSLESNGLKSKLLTNGNVEHHLKHENFETGAPLNGVCELTSNQNHIETGAPLNGVCMVTSNQNHIETSEPLNGLRGDSAQPKVVKTGVLADGKCLHISQENVNKTGESLHGICEDLAQSKHVQTNGKCAHTQEIVIETVEPPNCIREDLTQSKHVETGVHLNVKCVHTQAIVIETAEPLNCTCGDFAQPKHLETGTLVSGNFGKTANDKDYEAVHNGECEDTSDQKEIRIGVQDNGAMHNSHSDSREDSHSVNGNCGNTAKDMDIEAGLSGVLEDLTQSKHVETGVHLNGKCVHAQEIVIETTGLFNCTCGDLAQPKHLGTGALTSGNFGKTANDKDNEAVCNGVCEDTSDQKEIQIGLQDNGAMHYSHSDREDSHSVNGNCGKTAKVQDNEAGLSGICEDTSGQKEIKIGVQDNGTMHDSHFDREQEITAFSSVQDWVDSLSVEIGHERDNQLQGPLNCLNDCVDGLEKFALSRHRSRLHQHFGYSSPSELFEKVLFSEDEETKARTETNSTASSSFSSINACQPTETETPPIHAHAPSLRNWSVNPDISGVKDSIEQDAQRSLAGLLRKSFRRGSLLPVSPKTRVVVNGHTLSSAAVKKAEERAGKLRPGSYWYDCKAGFWGVEGGPCLGILPPYIEELNYSMSKHCSNGDTQVYVNGRELHVKDIAVLSQRGLSQKAGRAYALGFDGVLVDETTGLELKQLGKLAPTVERKGKGFGMFTADVLQSKAPAAHQIKPANSRN